MYPLPLSTYLQVAPVFAITNADFPPTPTEEDSYVTDGPVGSLATHHELEIIFEVIGTPPWASIEAVPMAAWRRYLRGVPAR